MVGRVWGGWAVLTPVPWPRAGAPLQPLKRRGQGEAGLGVWVGPQGPGGPMAARALRTKPTVTHPDPRQCSQRPLSRAARAPQAAPSCHRISPDQTGTAIPSRPKMLGPTRPDPAVCVLRVASGGTGFPPCSESLRLSGCALKTVEKREGVRKREGVEAKRVGHYDH